MTPVGTSNTQLYSPSQMNSQSKNSEAEKPAPLKVEQNTVKLSNEGKALLSALKEIDKEAKKLKQRMKPLPIRLNHLLMAL